MYIRYDTVRYGIVVRSDRSEIPLIHVREINGTVSGGCIELHMVIDRQTDRQAGSCSPIRDLLFYLYI